MARTLQRLVFVWLNRLLQLVFRYSPVKWSRLNGWTLAMLWWTARRAWDLGAGWREVDDGIPF